MNTTNRVEKLLNIMEKFLDALQYEHMSEAFEGKDPIDFMCDDSKEEIGVPWEDYWCGDPGPKWPECPECQKVPNSLTGQANKEENEEEEREEITRTVVDHTPKAKCEKLEKENTHLSFLLDTICDLYGCKKENINWEITIVYDPKVIEKIHKILDKERK